MGALAASAVATLAGVGAPATGLGAVTVPVVLAVLAAALFRRARRCALDLIVESREWLPVAAVQRQRRHLLKQQTRERLATSGPPGRLARTELFCPVRDAVLGLQRS